MLRINLLPSYVTQRRLTKQLIPIFVGAFLLCLAAPLVVYFTLHTALVNLTQQASDAVAGKAKTDGYKADAVTTLAQVAPINAKLQFFNDVEAYPLKWIELFNTLADTTPKSSFIYTGAAVTGTTLALKAYSPSVEEVGRYLQVMYHEPDFTTVAVDKIPAYPDNIRHLYYLNGVMVFADGATAGSSSGGGGGMGGGFSGGRGGFPGGGGQGGQVATGAPANWTPDALGPNGPTNIPDGVGPPPAEIAVGGTPTGNQNGGGGFPGGGGQGAGATGGYSPKFLSVAGRNISPFASPAVRDQILHNALRRVVVKTVAKGFDINVTAMLKQPLTAPGLPGSAPAGGMPGGMPGGGAPRGMMGGSPGAAGSAG